MTIFILFYFFFLSTLNIKNKYTGRESNPGLPLGRREFYHRTGTIAVLKTDSLPKRGDCGLIFMMKRKNEKENKTKQNLTKTNKQKRQGTKGYTNNPGVSALTL